MSAITVWFNKGFSTTYNLIETLRAARQGETFRVLCTHSNRDFPAFLLSDAWELEPHGLDESRYVAWCLDFARSHRVDVFLPYKHRRALAAARPQFEELGVRLVVAADAETLALLDHKGAFYAALGPDGASVPEHRVVNDLAGFDEAHAWLKSRHRTVCFKPCVSLYGLGFRILSEEGSELDHLFCGDVMKIGLAEARRLLGQQPSFRDLMVMQYLPGRERSVDCLAHEGQLVRCVVRLKPAGEGGQLLEDNPVVEEVAHRLAARFRLGGLFNVQLRDSGGVSYLLEVNPRASGGLHYSCLSGVAFPYWAVRLALGTARPEDVPRPHTGFRVAQVNRALRV